MTESMETRAHGASEKGRRWAKISWRYNAYMCVFTEYL